MRITTRLLEALASFYARRGNTKQAIYWYGKAGEESMSTRSLTTYAALLQGAGLSLRGAKVLSKLLEAEPKADVLLRRGQIYQENGRLDEALKDLTEALSLDDSSYAAWYIRAIVLADLGREAEAAKDLQEALLRVDRKSASLVRYELGNMYLRLQSYELAIEAYRASLSDADRSVPLQRFRLGEALEGAGRSEEALLEVRGAVLEQAQLHKQTDKGLVYYRLRTRYSLDGVRNALAQVDAEYGFSLKLSQLLEKAGKLPEALSAVEQGLHHYPDAEELMLRKGTLLRTMNLRAEARAQYDDIIAKYPDRLSGYMEKCALHRRAEEWTESLEALEQARRQFPEDRVVQFWLVDVLREAGRREDAWRESRRLTKLEPDDPLNWKQQAEIAIDESRFGDADEAYSRAISLSPQADFYLRRSFTRYMDDRYEEALLDLETAGELDASLLKESRTVYARGELYAGMNNLELADAEFGRAIEMERSNPLLYERRARCRIAMERYEDALEDCHAGLAIEPGNVRILRLRSMIHYRIGDYEASLLDCLAFRSARPSESEAHFNAGIVFSKLDRTDEALSALSRAIELAPFEGQAYLERASLRYHKQFDRASAADDLAQWLLYSAGGASEAERLAALHDLDGFDDGVRDLARDSYLRQYGSGGQSIYLS